jgi:hypothetical protein
MNPLVGALVLGLAAQARPASATEEAGVAAAAARIDDAVGAALRARGLRPAPPCSDETFVRRAFLDVIGTLPEPQELRAFAQDPRPDKRARLIDALLERPEFADYASLRWCDVLRVRSEFQINLWPNAVQAYHRWIHDSLAENLPYDRFARELLTSSGSNFRVPQVNFYRAVQGRSPADLAGAVALTFLGVRIDTLPADRVAGLSAFFARIDYKPTSEWKEEIVLLDPAPVERASARLPDGTSTVLRPEDDPRRVFASWLVRADNPWFARNAVNRVWAWLFGRGVVHEPDDFRPDNPPGVPGLLEVLAQELVGAQWDMRHVYRAILNSGTYQQSSIPAGAGDAAGSEACFAAYPVRRLDAEVLIDALCRVTGTREEYTSPIPEPFTYVPRDQRTILLADGSITSSFLELFGRPARDTGLFCERNNQPTEEQRLYLLNSSQVQRKIEDSARLRALQREARGDAAAFVRALYLLVLSRAPLPEEIDAARRHAQSLGARQAADDLAWALINSAEFQYRH